ncbi:MAG TPA: divalent-cation tolerance protein CutA [Candidatus Saccharimonadales bacterium]|nr:divalent-cation tolerance protein CutA [Candidatus Saccharimonadales bacterium]
MKLLYVTLNTADEARKIGKELLDKNLANCVNFFPITCMYKYKGEITDEPEVVLIVKTKDGYYKKIEEVIKKYINFENFIGQFSVEKINDEFTSWLNEVVK